MKIRTPWPWMLLLLIMLALISPLGREISNNLFSSEQLSRSIAQFMTMVYLGGLFALALTELGIRVVLIRRAQRDRQSQQRVSD